MLRNISLSLSVFCAAKDGCRRRHRSIMARYSHNNDLNAGHSLAELWFGAPGDSLPAWWQRLFRNHTLQLEPDRACPRQGQASGCDPTELVS